MNMNILKLYKSYETFSGNNLMLESYEHEHGTYVGYIDEYGDSGFMYNALGECISFMPDTINNAQILTKTQFSDHDIVISPEELVAETETKLHTFNITFKSTVRVNGRDMEDAINKFTSEFLCRNEADIILVKKVEE